MLFILPITARAKRAKSMSASFTAATPWPRTVFET